VVDLCAQGDPALTHAEDVLSHWVVTSLAPAPQSALQLEDELRDRTRILPTGCERYALAAWSMLGMCSCPEQAPCRGCASSLDAVPTCSIDSLLGGGLFEGRVTEIAGESASGMGSLLLLCLREDNDMTYIAACLHRQDADMPPGCCTQCQPW
jgi:hypothetical protein